MLEMKIKNVIIYICFVACVISLSSCYNYGKTHEPYTNSSIDYHLPPPPEKIVGKADTKKEYLQKAYTDIKNNLQEADVVMIEDSIKVLFPENIKYLSKETLPSTEYQMPLQKFSALLLKYSKTNILISGHTDNKGNEKLNKELSNIRAFNIKNILMQDGIKDYRLKSWGVGSLSPIETNETPQGREKNRRVEFVVLYNQK